MCRFLYSYFPRSESVVHSTIGRYKIQVHERKLYIPLYRTANDELAQRDVVSRSSLPYRVVQSPDGQKLRTQRNLPFRNGSESSGSVNYGECFH